MGEALDVEVDDLAGVDVIDPEEQLVGNGGQHALLDLALDLEAGGAEGVLPEPAVVEEAALEVGVAGELADRSVAEPLAGVGVQEPRNEVLEVLGEVAGEAVDAALLDALEDLLGGLVEGVREGQQPGREFVEEAAEGPEVYAARVELVWLALLWMISGAMYSGVPQKEVPATPYLESPKSESLALPCLSSRMFSGLRSR